MKRDGLKYENGNVLDPRDGKIYKAKMTRQPRRTDADDARLSRLSRCSARTRPGRGCRIPSMAQVDPAIVAKYLPAQAAAVKPPAGSQSMKPARARGEEEAPHPSGSAAAPRQRTHASRLQLLAARGRDRRHRLRDHFRHRGIELQHRGRGRQGRVRHRGVAFGARMHRAAIDRRQNPQVASWMSDGCCDDGRPCG